MCYKQRSLCGPFRGYVRNQLCIANLAAGSQLVQFGSCSEIDDSQRGREAVNTEFD
jgi:hypothetical protein